MARVCSWHTPLTQTRNQIDAEDGTRITDWLGSHMWNEHKKDPAVDAQSGSDVVTGFNKMDGLCVVKITKLLDY